MRSLFKPREPGQMLQVDFSEMERRVAASMGIGGVIDDYKVRLLEDMERRGVVMNPEPCTLVDMACEQLYKEGRCQRTLLGEYYVDVSRQASKRVHDE